MLICPVCKSSLLKEDAQFSCSQGHSFDVAKEGYVNLLIRQGKVAVFEGDSAEMLTARRNFLAGGYYGKLRSKITSLVGEVVKDRPGVVVDAGCGEGYYLGGMMSGKESEGLQFCGTDFSKKAVAMAAKEYSEVVFVGADTNTFLPFPDNSVDAIVNIFAPRSDQEFQRILKPNGRLIVVIPGPHHLQSLRAEFNLLGMEEDKLEKVQVKLPSFVVESLDVLEESIQLDGDSLTSLIGMTPSARFLKDEIRERIQAVEIVTTTVQFQVLVCKKV